MASYNDNTDNQGYSASTRGTGTGTGAGLGDYGTGTTTTGGGLGAGQTVGDLRGIPHSSATSDPYSATRGSQAGSGVGPTSAGVGYDPATHQASEVARHPVGAGSHPTHPVAGAEARDYGTSSSAPTTTGVVGSHGTHGAAGASTGSTAFEAKEALKHPGAAASHPAHPGLAATAEEARKGGHQTEAGARRDPEAPNPASSGGRDPSHLTGSSTASHGSATEHSGAHGAQMHEGAAHKPTIGDKVFGAVESLVGKVTGNPAKVEEGNLKKTEGKEAAARAYEGGGGPHHA
ncbi:hypothetical protein JCM11251_006162 [Rhodosporidiobolus azoricus]